VNVSLIVSCLSVLYRINSLHSDDVHYTFAMSFSPIFVLLVLYSTYTFLIMVHRYIYCHDLVTPCDTGVPLTLTQPLTLADHFPDLSGNVQYYQALSNSEWFSYLKWLYQYRSLALLPFKSTLNSTINYPLFLLVSKFLLFWIVQEYTEIYIFPRVHIPVYLEKGPNKLSPCANIEDFISPWILIASVSFQAHSKWYEESFFWV